MRKAFSFDKPRTSQQLANKKAPEEKPSAEPVVGDSLGLSQPLKDLAGPPLGYRLFLPVADGYFPKILFITTSRMGGHKENIKTLHRDR